MLQVFICDDEKTFCSDLRQIVQVELELHGIKFCIMEFFSGNALLSHFREAQRQGDSHIFFLDIEMEGTCDGMDTAHQLRSADESAVIIFVTAHADFVFQGYDVRALHYILKPCEREQIARVLAAGLALLDAKKDACFCIRRKQGELLLPYESILYFKSQGHQVYAVTADASYSFYGKLSELETFLPSCFVRSHNRYLINLRHLSALDGNQVLIRRQALPVSRSCKQGLSIAYARYILT
ncbi:MAG: response regulator transcription factor [Firmicutes bacterium]|nr:response regulator transcription factor [Bacillota bacterium]